MATERPAAAGESGGPPIEEEVRVVITAFGPFEGVPLNPTQQLLESLMTEDASSRQQQEGGCCCRLVVLETSAEGALEALRGVWADSEASRPSSVVPVVLFVHLGVDSGAEEVHLECQAFNEADFRCPDQRGFQPCKQPIVPHPDAPPRLLTDLDVDALVRQLQAEGWPVSASHDAGRYVCNYVYYQSLWRCKQQQQQRRAAPMLRGATPTTAQQPQQEEGGRWCSLFVHVPPASRLPLDRQRAFLAALLAALAHQLPLQQAHLPPTLHHQPLPLARQGGEAGLLVEAMLDMGFSRPQAEAAVRVLGPEAGLEAAINWVLETGGVIETTTTAQQPRRRSSQEEDGATTVMGALLREGGARCKMVLLVRQDLGMSAGKIAAQCCHAALAAYQSCVEEGRYGEDGRAAVAAWQLQGEPVIALRVPDLTTLLALEEQARSGGLLPVARVQDAGRTQVEAGSLTVVALGPAPAPLIDSITGHLRLL